MIPLVLAALAAASSGDGVHANWELATDAVEVGEPFELVLEVEAPRTVDVFSLADVELVPDEALVLLSERSAAPELVEGGARLRARRVFRLASLRPGDVDLASLVPGFSENVSVTGGDGLHLGVRGVLEEDEVEPRGPKGFPEGFLELPVDASPARPGVWALVVLVAAALGIAALVWRRARRSRGRASAPPDPLQEISRLETQARAGEVEGREVVREVTELLRHAPVLAPEHPGVTDEEWARELRNSHRISEDCAKEFDALLAEVREVKYAGRDPSPWAVRETIERAERVLVAAAAGKEESR